MKGGKPLFQQWENWYIVRDRVWLKAGMDGWNSGYLCTPCLAKRLGRDLRSSDYLVRAVGATSEALAINAIPDYFKHYSIGFTPKHALAVYRKTKGRFLITAADVKRVSVKNP